MAELFETEWNISPSSPLAASQHALPSLLPHPAHRHLYRPAAAAPPCPAAAAAEPFQNKCAYDMVDYGLGFCANPLELGCDCLGHIK